MSSLNDEFTLTMRLGNEALQTGGADAIAEALRQVAATIQEEDRRENDGVVVDANGNSVGSWAYAMDPLPQES